MRYLLLRVAYPDSGWAVVGKLVVWVQQPNTLGSSKATLHRAAELELAAMLCDKIQGFSIHKPTAISDEFTLPRSNVRSLGPKRIWIIPMRLRTEEQNRNVHVSRTNSILLGRNSTTGIEGESPKSNRVIHLEIG